MRSDFRKHEVPGLKKEFEVLQNVTNINQLVALDQEEKEIETAANAIQNEEAEPKKCTFPDPEDEPDICQEIDPTKYSSWEKLLDVSARVVLAAKLFKRRGRQEEDPLTLVECKLIAKKLWLKSAMEDTKKMLQKTKIHGLIVFERDEVDVRNDKDKK